MSSFKSKNLVKLDLKYQVLCVLLRNFVVAMETFNKILSNILKNTFGLLILPNDIPIMHRLVKGTYKFKMKIIWGFYTNFRLKPLSCLTVAWQLYWRVTMENLFLYLVLGSILLVEEKLIDLQRGPNMTPILPSSLL